MNPREYIEWRDLWVTGANENKLPRVLFVGDSIVCSYFAKVEEELKGIFLCARMASSTSVCDKAFKKELDLLFADYRFAIIHFNNGLHGWDNDEVSYKKGLRDVLDFCTRRSPQSRLIWASSTPMRRTDDLAALEAKTERVRERNRIAFEIATKRNLPINDLFACVIDHPEYTAPDGVHFNADGQRVLGKQVAQMVLAEGNRKAELSPAAPVLFERLLAAVPLPNCGS